MIKIHFIAPYAELKPVVDKVFLEHRNHDKISKSISVVAVNELPSIKIGNCDVIVARGYAAQYLTEQGVDIPVVDINISGYDVFRSVQECNEVYNPRKIAFIGFYSAFVGVEEFSKLIGCRVKVYIPRDYDNVPEVIRKALEDGCDAVIGGQYIVDQAKKMRIHSIAIRTGEEAIHRAIDEAIRTYEIVAQERIKSKVYEMITHSAKDGIVYVDKGMNLQVVNEVALNIFGITNKIYTFEKEFKVFVESFEKVMRDNKEIIGELNQIKGVTVSVDYAPIMDKENFEGVVITFQNITKVQMLENNIRRQLSDKGLCAKSTFKDIIHESKLLDETIEISKKYAISSSNIMLVGETGTGKEVFGQSIHNASKRAKGSFVAVNCAALPENLLESELFGYVEGAFTGASKKGKIGLFELAHNGTLFLDEIGEIPLAMQSKLLRVLQEKEVRRIGDDKVISVDVRIICATNKNLQSMVLKGLFRQDLLYRLDVLKIFLPPLRERREDIIKLFKSMLEEQCRVNKQKIPRVELCAEKVLLEYNYPGNVRELSNIVERVNVIRLQEGVITGHDMKNAIYSEDVGAEIYTGGTKDVLTEERLVKGEKEEVIKAIEENLGNMTQAAKSLNIDRSTLWRKMKKWDIKK